MSNPRNALFLLQFLMHTTHSLHFSDPSNTTHYQLRILDGSSERVHPSLNAAAIPSALVRLCNAFLSAFAENSSYTEIATRSCIGDSIEFHEATPYTCVALDRMTNGTALNDFESCVMNIPLKDSSEFSAKGPELAILFSLLAAALLTTGYAYYRKSRSAQHDATTPANYHAALFRPDNSSTSASDTQHDDNDKSTLSQNPV